RGIGASGRGVYLDFADAIKRLGKKVIEERYGNLFEMYHDITAEDPYETPMRIYPAPHYAMGGLWVDYNLMSNIPGLYVIGEANFSDHGANRLGASALMQGLADGYFVLPVTIGDYLAGQLGKKVTADRPEFKAAEKEVNDRVAKLLAAKGTRSVDSYHRELGSIMWEYCGMARSKEGLERGIKLVRDLRAQYWRDVKVLGTNEEPNQALEKAGRVADFFELAELMCIDALQRDESAGAHFRVEYQTADGEAKRNDDQYLYVSAWAYTGDDSEPRLHKETLEYEEVKLATRSYK
ncbi:MAG TPA: FAD-binding protein, partial [Thermoanaerobaculia bacterium]|nr:FAD-binding protein [Thermoanaerobaculia bacterium]